MERIYKSLIELIGNTPLLEVSNIEREEALKARLLVKVESFNPGGSVKDRAAYYMIEDAEKRGVLTPGALIIEPTSGNTGIGLAWVASLKGYKLVLTMPDTMSVERRNLLKALGASIVLTPGAEGMSGAIRKAMELKNENPGSVILQQFDNKANPASHENTTAEEIWRDTDGKVDVFVSAVGTGGTVSGTGRGLKKHNRDIEVVAVEPEGSPVLEGGKPGPHKIQGIGAGFIPENYYAEVVRSEERRVGKECRSCWWASRQVPLSVPRLSLLKSPNTAEKRLLCCCPILASVICRPYFMHLIHIHFNEYMVNLC